MKRQRATFRDTQVGASLNLTLVTRKDGGPVEVLTLPLIPLTWLLALVWWSMTYAAGLGQMIETVVLWPGGLLQEVIARLGVAYLVTQIGFKAGLYGFVGVNL